MPNIMLSILLVLLILPASAQQRGLKVVTRTPDGATLELYDNSWAVVIGVNQYQKWSQLQYAVPDAQAVRDKLIQLGFPQGNIIYLTDAQATKNRIELVLGDELRRKLGRNDRVFIYFAGHGQTEDLPGGKQEGYIVPVDGDKSNLFSTCISMTSVRQFSERMPAKHVFYAIDACYSGLALMRAGELDPRDQQYLQKVARFPARQLVTAGSGGEQVIEQGGHGAFTKTLLIALDGSADKYPPFGVVTGSELGNYLQPTVSMETNHGQTPQFGRLAAGEGEFMFVLPELDTRRSFPSPKPITPPPPVAVQYGHLQVNSNAPSSQVHVDGTYRGVASPGQPLNLENIGQGQVHIQVTASGYEESTESATLRAGQWAQVAVELKPVLVAPSPIVEERPRSRPSNRPNASSVGNRAGESRAFTLLGGASIEMVWVPAGMFVMGSPGTEDGRFGSEVPHRVTLSQGYWLGRFEVTQAQWEAVMGNNPSFYRGSNHPVEQVSWEDVQGFIEKVNRSAGNSVYRLPTEAEWEYACRAGTTTRWSFGDDETQLGDYAWYVDNAWNTGLQYARPVGTKLPNPWGLYDVHGNVWEWCQDWYGDYLIGAQIDPIGPASGWARVFRGGSFYDVARITRSATRNNYTPGDHFNYLGFRLLRTE